MGRCIEFYEKWERDPNWCEKCPSAVSQINSYIDLVDSLKQKGIDRDFTIVNLPEGAARPLITEKDPVVKEKVIEKISEDLKGEQTIINEQNAKQGAGRGNKKEQRKGKGGKGRGHKKKYTASDVKKVINSIKAAEIKPTPLPEGKYNVVLADPPWRYTPAVANRQIENQYPTMETKDICALSKDIPFTDDCILFLWGTASKLKDALTVMDAWGFEYKTHAIWDKQIIGMGYYFRGQHELLLVGRKGDPGVPASENRPSSIISAKRTEHSKKPNVVYNIIEKMYPNGKYLELFARSKHNDRWVVWGSEVLV